MTPQERIDNLNEVLRIDAEQIETALRNFAKARDVLEAAQAARLSHQKHLNEALADLLKAERLEAAKLRATGKALGHE